MAAGSHHGADFASCQHAGDGRADEAAEDGEAVLAPVAGVEEEEAAPVEAVPMLLATPAAADTPIAVPTDKLFFDKANGVITALMRIGLPK